MSGVFSCFAMYGIIPVPPASVVFLVVLQYAMSAAPQWRGSCDPVYQQRTEQRNYSLSQTSFPQHAHEKVEVTVLGQGRERS